MYTAETIAGYVWFVYAFAVWRIIENLFFFGADIGGLVSGFSYPNAIIDELMIWNSVALSADQVADVFYALGEHLLFRNKLSWMLVVLCMISRVWWSQLAFVTVPTFGFVSILNQHNAGKTCLRSIGGKPLFLNIPNHLDSVRC